MEKKIGVTKEEFLSEVHNYIEQQVGQGMKPDVINAMTVGLLKGLRLADVLSEEEANDLYHDLEYKSANKDLTEE